MGCGIRRIIRLNNAITKDIAQLIQLFDGDNNNITLNCNYSWSVDGVCWTEWIDYQNYLRIIKYLENDFYLRILINTSLGNIALDNCYTKDYSITIDGSATFIQDFCGETNIFKPYDNLDCALKLQQQLADSVVCMFGIPIYYFRCDPKP